MIVKFVSCHSAVRIELFKADIFPQSEKFDSKSEIAKFYIDGDLVAVYDGKINMLFFEPKKETE
jgi:hypothetical protein